MRQTLSATLPNPPPDPINQIASQLGLSVDQVRAAFADPACPGRIMIRRSGDASQLAGPAQRLGVTTDRLAAAIQASAPPLPPSIDDLIARLAQNLGVTTEQLRAALEKVEGPNQFYFVVPAPAQAP
jgi:hypothetical protein